MKQNKFFSFWGAKVFSLLLAILTVLLIEFTNITDRVITIPLSVTLPDDFEAESLVPESVDVVISGNENVIYLVDPAGIKARADFSAVDSAGITSVPVILEYREDIYKKNTIAIYSDPSSVRILFGEPDD